MMNDFVKHRTLDQIIDFSAWLAGIGEVHIELLQKAPMWLWAKRMERVNFDIRVEGTLRKIASMP